MCNAKYVCGNKTVLGRGKMGTVVGIRNVDSFGGSENMQMRIPKEF